MSTLRLVLRRIRRQLPTISAVVVLILITTVLLATLAQFTGATGDAAAQTALASWHKDGRSTLKVDAHPAPADRVVALASLTADVAPLPGVAVETSQVSVSYALPGKNKNGDPPLMTFWAASDLDQHAKLTAGAWPAAGSGASGPVQVAVPRAAAEALKLTVGSRLSVSSRITHTQVDATVVGLYDPDNAQEQYWRLDPLQGLGQHHPAAGGTGFDSYGPFAVDPEAFDRKTAPVEFTSLHALVVPDTAHVGDAGLVPLADTMNTVSSAILTDAKLGGGVQASTQMPALISGLRHSLSVIASSALIPAIQLAALALCALIMSAGLLQDFRATTIALMRARGAGAPTIALQSAIEALIFTVPAGLAAPWIASRTVPHILKGAPAIAPTAGTWAAALATAGICAATLVGSALKGSASKGGFAEAQRSRGRPSRGKAIRRVALDVCAIGLGFVGYLELRRYGAAGGGFGEGGVNAVLVLAPALALMAAALVAVRVVPLVGRIGDSTARRGPGFAAPLGAFRAGRGGRVGTPALLLVAAIAMAVLTASYSASWTRAQRDQAAFSVGSDVRAAGFTTTGFRVAGVGQNLPGAADAALVSRDIASAGSAQPTSVSVLGIEGEKVPSVMNLRPDLFPAGPSKLPALLDSARPPAPSSTLPGHPRELQVKLKAPLVTGQGPTPPDLGVTFSLAGRLGPATTASTRIPMDGQVHAVTLDLGTAGGAAWPLHLTDISLTYQYAEYLPTAEIDGVLTPMPYLPTSPDSLPAKLDVDILSVQTADAVGGPGTPVGIGDPASLRMQGSTDDPAVAGQPNFAHGKASAVPGEFLHITTDLPASDAYQDVRFGRHSVQMDAFTAPLFDAAVPVIASDGYLAATGQHVGDTAQLSVNGDTAVRVKIVGTVRALPTTQAGEAALLADNATWRAATVAAGAEITQGNNLEWWVRAQPGQDGAVAADLRATGLPATVTSSADVLSGLVGNPVQAGIKVAFWLAAAAALTFAAIDFLVHLVGAVRERTTQNALVRALGASTRQVGVATAVELAFLVLVGLCFGVAVGELLAHLLVPAITVSPDGSPPAPPVLVSDPWVRVAEFAAGAVAALALGVAGVMSAGRRDAVGSSLRLGED